MKRNQTRTLCTYIQIQNYHYHYADVIIGAMASQVTSLTIVYSTVYSGADQRKHQISASLAFVRGIHRCPVISPHKGPVTRKMLPFDDVIMMLFTFYNGSYVLSWLRLFQMWEICVHWQTPNKINWMETFISQDRKINPNVMSWHECVFIIR